MSTEITAMHEMIERIDCLFKKGFDDGGLRTCKEIAIQLISKEKEQIELAYFDGVERELNGDAISPQEYFNQTYNNQNKKP